MKTLPAGELAKKSFRFPMRLADSVELRFVDWSAMMVRGGADKTRTAARAGIGVKGWR
jgi:hypothetical protein